MQVGGSVGALWAGGEMLLRVRGPSPGPARVVRVRRPYATLGRAGGADVQVVDPAVSGRHVYFHMDRRGLFAVDLASRTGTRFDGEAGQAGWLGPGRGLEVAGHDVEVLELHLDGLPLDPPACDDDPLAGAGIPLARVSLEPRGGEAPWVLGSEIVFLGRSGSCGVQIPGASAARAHCALVRTVDAAYVVDLIGRLTWLNQRPIRGAAALRDGDVLSVGDTPLIVRLGPPPAAAVPGQTLDVYHGEPAGSLPARSGPGGWLSPLDGVPAEAQGTVLAWMIGALQAGQGELARRQDEFQAAMVRALQQIQADNATMLDAHLGRLDAIHRELAELRAACARMQAPPAPGPRRPALPEVEPLRIPPRPQHDPASHAVGKGVGMSWMLQRINQLEDENRSTLRDLIGKIAPKGARREPGNPGS